MKNDFKDTFKDLQPKQKSLLDGFSRDFLIKACEQKGEAWHEIVFCASSICHLRDEGNGTSTIVLSPGKEIPVRLSFDALKKNIFSPHMTAGQELDLTVETKPVETGGKKVEGQGVYLGQYKPKDRDGKSLSKTFNVFAAPEDLPETMKYVDAVKYIAKLKNWNGFDGTNYATDKELFATLKSGSYNGGWIIPTRDILHGKDVDGIDTTPDNILAHKDKGSLKGTFKMTASRDGSDYPAWYWSSTEHRDLPSLVWVVRLSDGNDGWGLKDFIRLSCRPVRLVEVVTP